MHVGKVYAYDNIFYHNEIINYAYKIKPINSLFASESQQSTLLDTMFKLISDINMPGMIFIKPRKIQNRKILMAYSENFKKYGNSSFKGIAKDYIQSIKEIISKAIKYRYEIYFIFCDGRDELKKYQPLKLFKTTTKKLNKHEIELYSLVEEEIYKQLQKSVNATRITSDEVTALMNYIAIPVENNIVDYYVEDAPTELKYDYQLVNRSSYNAIYTKTLVAGRDKTLVKENIKKATDIFNRLQLGKFPVDVFIKFDLEHAKEFVKNMAGKEESIKKANRRFFKQIGENDPNALKAKLIARAGAEADISFEHSKVRYQMFLRVRANDKEMLEKRCDSLRTRFEKRMSLSSEIGQQLTLANNLFPYRTSFRKYIQLADISYFVQYNFLGGLFIGDEKEGMIETYTYPGQIPVFYDISNPLLGKTRTASSTTVYVGETGSGKTQLCDHRVFVNMIFKGMRTLTIDPKGDREKKILLLGENASHLKIGSPDCKDGMFDPYLMNAGDEVEALSQVKRDIDSLARALDKNIQINFMYINRANDDMLKDLKNKKIKQCTFCNLLKYLREYDPYLADQLESLKKDPMARLFFAQDDTSIDMSFNLTKSYNLITFARMPLFNDKGQVMDFNPNRLDHAIFSVVLSRITGITLNFMKLFGTEENQVVFEEYKVFQKVPGGEEIVDSTVRQGRSWQTHVNIITQAMSDISDSIMNNVGDIYVGSLKSTSEINHVLNELKIQNHSAVREALIDHTTDEGLLEERKYNFLFQDYNNRKCITKLQIPRCFAEVFRTLKDEEINNVPVTGTKQEAVSND